MGGVIGATGVLAFRTVLKMHNRSSSKYLAKKDSIKDVAEGLGLRAKSKVEGFLNSFISLFIGKKTRGVEATKEVVEAQSLQKHLQF